jgi:tRNA-2-methylthio-N6-dimethylallyladenosine synthase
MYSIREGTRAAKMPNQVPEEVKKERFHRLLELQKKKSLERNREMQGKTYEVLVEGLGEKNRLTGRTLGNKVINFDGDINLEGKLVNVRVTDYNTWSLYGEIVGE